MQYEFNMNPGELARKVSEAVQLDGWRRSVREDSETARWAHIFDMVKPSENLYYPTVALIKATGGNLSADFLYSQLLAAYSYGFAAACSGLADEDFMLWEGLPPLDFPDVVEGVEGDERDERDA